jgi:RHS repeat-associated protein
VGKTISGNFNKKSNQLCPPSIAVRIDANGNRIYGNYTIGSNNQLISDGTYNYNYDSEGNLITQTEIATGVVEELTWDYRNRLVGIVTKDSNGNVIESVEYTYDVYDRRIAKTVDTETERYIYQGDNLTLVFDEAGNRSERYLYGMGIDEILASENSNNTVTWSLADAQGSIKDVIDNNGEVLKHINYDVFGNITSDSNPNLEFRFSYTGRELDTETGNYYYRSRYYDGFNGRFISEDTIGFEGNDTNLYRYVGNSPTNYTDPTGNIAFIPFLIGVGKVATATTVVTVVADGISPDGVQAPTIDCGLVPNLDKSGERAVWEFVLSAGGSGLKSLPSFLKGASGFLDDAAKGTDDLFRGLSP